jgi:hypothetical protein
LNRQIELLFAVWLRKKVRARSESGAHLFRLTSGRGVENTEPVAQQNCLPRDVTSAVYFGLEIYVCKKRVDMEWRSKVDKSLWYVAGRENLVTPAQNHRFGHFSNEKIVFNDQYHGHWNSSRRDN